MDRGHVIMRTGKSTSLDKENPNADRRFIVKYTKEERLDIGRQIYTGELSRYKASEKYGISINTARDYMPACQRAPVFKLRKRGFFDRQKIPTKWSGFLYLEEITSSGSP